MRKKIFGLSTIVLMLLGLAACKAALAVPTLGNKPRKLAPGHVLVQIGFNEFPTYRTVYPDEWVEDDDYVDGQNQKRSSLTYTLHKGTIDGAILGTSDLSWGDIKKGYFIDLPDGSNTVFLVAKKGDKIALVASNYNCSRTGYAYLYFKAVSRRQYAGVRYQHCARKY